ncbi:proline iminopeptidase [Saccharothrix ecbatanensis]|uniref:Proline iminopeptidase n=1 Tax=Saccharothrix ecbatanensis TaxID=1105145 RepID=A0A7W9HMR2_9PSEU|nr:alpha/beta hydrolase [Saccharothrix ecbatanensis]MBB5804624.1 proline iminopeptidase [Saccharothrix ecbatanensis]
MEEHKVITDDGRVLWAAELGRSEPGRGEPLVLCHGGPGLWDMFDGVAELLAARVRVIRWDQRGGGRSERGGPYTVARTLADLDAIRVHFGLSQMALLGHSWGADVALHYALEHPDRVSSLIYVAGTGLGQDWRDEYRRNRAERLGAERPGAELGAEPPDGEPGGKVGRAAAIRQWTADFADPSTARRHAEDLATPWFGVNEEANAALNAESHAWDEQDLVARCRELAVPTLIVDGAADVRPRWAVDSLAEALPDVARVVLPSAGHVPWVESPGSFGWAVLAHLAR